MWEMTEVPPLQKVYGSLDGMLRKFDRFARQDRFRGTSREDWQEWRERSLRILHSLLGMDKMESCPLSPLCLDRQPAEDGILREHWLIQTEPDIWMPFFLLIPDRPRPDARPFLCPCGHGGEGKYSVAGEARYSAVRERISFYRYDYGLQLARMGHIALCPDARGFGERREDLADTELPETALTGDCARLARMGEPLGIAVAGMLAWDLMRAADWLEEDGRFDTGRLSCLGFSGGGMQAMWLSILDSRVRFTVISGYLYGVRDSLLRMNRNCSCNYVPHLWEHFDLGDLVSLMAPRPLLVQTCREDRLNGPRGLRNVEEQMDTVRAAYALLGAEDRLLHEVCSGPHRWHGEHLEENMRTLLS